MQLSASGMALFKFPSRKPKSPVAPAAPSAKQPKTLAELEQEINAAQPLMKPYRIEPPPTRRSGFGGKLFFLLFLLGIPAAVIWVANLPYAPIRRPIARNASILLLPSYINVDRNFRDAIALTEQSKKLIDNATSFADIQMGAQKVTEAQAKLDALPLDLVSYWPDRYYYSWYGWRFSPIAFNGARTEVARLQAKVFQEQNANTALTDVDLALNKAKQNYQAAPDLVTKQGAITAWRVALNQLEMVPAQTLAGDLARQKLEPEKDEFQTIVGEAATSYETAVVIQSARSFAWEAAKRSQNPPHSVEEWEAIEELWEKAINLLDQVSIKTDPSGFAEAQKLMATYKANQSDIGIRKTAEREAIASLQNAQQEIQNLQAGLSYLDTNAIAARLQQILTELNSIKPGTTAYKEAEVLRLQATNKLQEIQP